MAGKSTIEDLLKANTIGIGAYGGFFNQLGMDGTSWRGQPGGNTEGGAPMLDMGPSTDAVGRANGYTFDFERKGPANSGVLTAYTPEGKQFGQYQQTDSTLGKDLTQAAALWGAGFGGLALAGLGPATGLFGSASGAGAATGGGSAGAGAGLGSGAATGGAITADMTAGLGAFAGTATPASVTAGMLGSGIPGLTAAAAAGAAGGAAGAAGGAGAATGGLGSALSGIGSTVKGAIGEKGANTLWDLGKLAVSGVLAGKAADSLAPGGMDMTAITDAQASASKIAERQMTLAEKTYADQQALLAEYSPMLKQMLTQQMADQQTASGRSASSWGDYLSTWRPVEQQLASQSLAMANPARYEQAGQKAGAGAATQFDRAMANNEQALQMAGASPEKIAAMAASGRLSAAKGIAGAQDAGFSAAQGQGLSVLDNASRFGRNMPSTSLLQSSLAGQQANSVQNGVQGLSSLTSAPAAMTNTLLSSAVQSGNSATNSLLAANQMNMQQNNARNAIFGDILGAGLGAIGMNGGLSGLFGG